MDAAKRMDRIAFSPMRKIFEEVVRREKEGAEIIQLQSGKPDFDTPANIKRAAMEALDRGQVSYTSNYGLPELRQAIASKMERDNGLTYDPDGEIVVTIGVAGSLSAAALGLLDPGDELLIAWPGFPSYRTMAYMAGAEPVLVQLNEADRWRPDLAAFEAAVTERSKALILSNPNNPTGTVFNRADLEAIAELAIKHDLWVISDEIYEKLIYDGREHVSMAALPGMRERTITLNGFSKAYAMTGWRLGYFCAPAEAVAAMAKAHQFSSICAVSFAQAGAIEALNGPQDAVAEMVAEYDRRRLMLTKRLAALPGLSFVEPDGAFYFLINITGLGKPAPELALYLLDEAEVSVVPWGETHIRVSYANSYDNLARALDRVERAVAKLRP